MAAMMECMTRPPRLRAALVLLTAIALSAGACGGDDAVGDDSGDITTVTAASSSTTPGAATSAPDATAFPVTVEHLWGSTTIEAAPSRVVTLGVTDADTVLQLGITPIALSGFAFF